MPLWARSGAEVVPELAPKEQDYVMPKRRYSGFFQTDLDILLKEQGNVVKNQFRENS